MEPVYAKKLRSVVYEEAWKNNAMFERNDYTAEIFKWS